MTLVYFSIILCVGLPSSIQPKNAISVWPKSVFPVELGETVTWQLTPVGGAVYNVESMISVEIDGLRAFRIQKSQCAGPYEKHFACKHNPGNDIALSFTPTEEFYGKELVLKYFENLDSLWAGNGPILMRESIQLTKQPTFVEVNMELIKPLRYHEHVPTELRLEPPVFITGSNVNVDCVTDGSLPPVPIMFSIECPPPPTAVVEHDRVTQAKQGMPYEKYYDRYGFRSPPTLSDLAPYVARKFANYLIVNGHVARGKDNKTIRATLSITEKAHDCHIVCRVAGKETRRRITVYYPTTISYLLPRPRDGYMQVGSEITCYADGHPPPMLSLRLAPPLRRPNVLTKEEYETMQETGRLPKLREQDPVTRELELINSGVDLIPQPQNPPVDVNKNGDLPVASSATLQQTPREKHNSWLIGGDGKEPYESAKRIPGIGLSAMDRHQQLGLHPNEYSIQGATFRLAPNATPGVELLLTCTARNVLPGDTTFLGLTGTMTRARFIVVAAPLSARYLTISYTSLAVSLGVCGCVLLILLIIIAAMLLQKRHQTRPGVQSDRMNANGTKIKGKPVPRQPYTKGQQPAARSSGSSGFPLGSRQSPHQTTLMTSTDQVSMHSGHPPNLNNMCNSDPNYHYGAVYDQTTPRNSSMFNPNQHELQYVELSFDHVPPGGAGHVQEPGVVPLKRGGPTSASMTLFGTTPRQRQPSRTHGASVPQGLDIASGTRAPVDEQHFAPLQDETSSHYTEIVAFMQPKAHSSQLVLQQQQEATQALLSMQQTKPRVFV